MSTTLRKELEAAQTQTAPLSASLPTTQGMARPFFNRELSLLEYHKLVLEEAFDESNPLLERLNFLSIFSANLDEFFMIRVSGLKEELEGNFTELSLDGMTPAEREERATAGGGAHDGPHEAEHHEKKTDPTPHGGNLACKL